MNKKVYAVMVEQSGRIYVVETSQQRAVDGIVYGNVDAFFDTLAEAQQHCNSLMLRTRNAW